MSNRWTDAAMSLYIFDDQCKNEKAKETSDSFRGQLLHLMSLLHCFACLVRALCFRLLHSFLLSQPALRSEANSMSGGTLRAAPDAERRGGSG